MPGKCRQEAVLGDLMIHIYENIKFVKNWCVEDYNIILILWEIFTRKYYKFTFYSCKIWKNCELTKLLKIIYIITLMYVVESNIKKILFVLLHWSNKVKQRGNSLRIRETSKRGRRSAQAWSVHERRNPSWQPWGSETSAWLRSFAKVFHYRVERVPSSLFHPPELPDVELRCSRPRLAHTRDQTLTCKLESAIFGPAKLNVRITSWIYWQNSTYKLYRWYVTFKYNTLSTFLHYFYD